MLALLSVSVNSRSALVYCWWLYGVSAAATQTDAVLPRRHMARQPRGTGGAGTFDLGSASRLPYLSRLPGGGDITCDIVEESKEYGDWGRKPCVGESRRIELPV